ncbi:hypothetical protein ACJRO7_016884 [Eucalyptus globulus]|uniref:Splicing factor YJU2 n=1 Tax=Eucalyptus globulus TaxID=34317 RepID=A0ABD3KUH0_EUCGL
MRERKVVEKYFFAGFLPSKLPRLRRSKNRPIKVRMMLPMSIRCNTCGGYITRAPSSIPGRRTSSARSTYLGIRILMFCFKCAHCSAELTIKTDPRNSDYLMESGAVEGEKRKRETEEMHYRIKYLENETLDSRREMDTLAALHEMQSVNSGRATVSTDAMLQGLQRTSAAKEEDEVVTKSVVFRTSKNFVRRIEHEDLTQPYASNDESLDNTLKFSGYSSASFHHVCSSSKLLSTSSSVRIAVVKKAGPTSSLSIALQSLCEYESSDDED